MRRFRRVKTLRSPGRVAGFTLLEVLLTAILSATLLAGLWTLFGTYLRLFESGQARVEQAQLVRALTRQIGDDLHGVVAPATRSIQSNRNPSIEPMAAGSGELRPVESPVAVPTTTSSGARGAVPQFSLVGTKRLLRLEVLQPASLIDTAQPTEPPVFGRLEKSSPRAAGLKTILYSFEPPREVAESDREPPPGLIRRELTWEQMQAAATGAGSPAAIRPGAHEEAGLVRGFVPLTPADVQDADQFDDSIIWTPEVLALRFRYFDGSTWFDEWDSRERKSLPVAVEIAMRLESVDESNRASRESGQRVPEGSATADGPPHDGRSDFANPDFGDGSLEAGSTSTSQAEVDDDEQVIRELVLLQPSSAGDDGRLHPQSMLFPNRTETTPR